MEVDYVLRRKTDSLAEALSWLEHMVSPVILEPIGYLWMELLIKAGFFYWVCCSGTMSVLPFGRVWLLSGHWDTRMNREQLAHSEQTAALQETFSMSSQSSSSAPTNTQKRLGSSPTLYPLFAAFVSPGCLPDFDLVNRINGTYKVWVNNF